ncbi:MAG: asparagine synthase C-terminal domain-containing protein [Atopobiaceae bacterium]|nr:asparagine synthase C-terminal domain-containing protein [Atopobiaceae bacterium]
MTKPSLDPKALEQYLRFSYPVDGSLFQGQKKAPVPEVRFSVTPGRSKDDYLQELLQILERMLAEERQCSDAAFLSSGVDSSLIAFGIRARKTFSVAYEEAEFNESDLAIQAARELGSEHHVARIGPAEYLGTVDEALASRPAPTGDASYVALFIAAQEAAQHTDVVCSGEGPDELFCGYPCYNRYFQSPSEDFWLATNTIMDIGEVPELARYGGDGFLKMNAFDLSIWMQNNILPNVVAAARGAGIAIRTPYVRPDLWDFALSLPPGLKANQTMGKLLFREAAQQYVGRTIAFREKRGFPVPVRKWMRLESYKERIWNTLTGAFARDALACVDVEGALAAYYCENDESAWKQVWEMFALIRWLKTVGERKQ